jgi:hypothetical protein
VELSYKLKTRAAILLRSKFSEREEIRSAVNRLYRFRSKVVHGRPAPPDFESAESGVNICLEAVRAMVGRANRPNFVAWELTGSPTDSPKE